MFAPNQNLLRGNCTMTHTQCESINPPPPQHVTNACARVEKGLRRAKCGKSRYMMRAAV